MRRATKPGLALAAAACVLAAGMPAAGDDTLYKYDALGRLIQVTYDSGQIVRYAYDALGNRRIVRSAASFSNTAPDAVNDAIAVVANEAITFYPTPNDSDVDADPLTITATGSASHGTVSRVGNRLTYTADWAYSGADSFTYTVSDGTTTDTATVNVTIAMPAAGQLGPDVTASSYVCNAGGGQYWDDPGDYPGEDTYINFCFGGPSSTLAETWPNDAVFHSLVHRPYCVNPVPWGESYLCGDGTGEDYIFMGEQVWTQNASSSWVKADLGAARLIDRVEIVQWNDNEAAATVEYSTDGSSWTTAGTADSYVGDPLDATGSWDTTNFGLVNARYIRVRVSNASLAVTGFKIFGWVNP